MALVGSLLGEEASAISNLELIDTSDGTRIWRDEYRRPLGLERGLQLFRQALDNDPTYARAWVGRAAAYQSAASWGRPQPELASSRSRDAAERAIAIDDTLASPHVTRGVIDELNWNWDVAGREHERAIELDPEFGEAWNNHGGYLAGQGRPEEARAGLEDEARVLFHELRQRTDGSVSSMQLALTRANLGDKDGAFALMERALDEKSFVPWMLRHPLFDGVRDDPRFGQVIKRMGLPS